MSNECKDKVGVVTEQEKDIIEKLYERKESLNELLIALDNIDISSEKKSDTHKKIINDKINTELKFNSWWNDMGQKYRWRGSENGIWAIDFKTNEIFLGKNNNLKPVLVHLSR